MTEIDPGQRFSDDIAGLWRQTGNLTRMVAIFDVRFDRVDREIAELKTDVRELKTDVAGLKTDVAGLKTDVAGLKTDVRELKTDVAGLKTDVTELKVEVGETKEQLNRLERATQNGFNRVDAQFERLVALIQRDELNQS
jgi:chromosome segregation ATPase